MNSPEGFDDRVDEALSFQADAQAAREGEVLDVLQQSVDEGFITTEEAEERLKAYHEAFSLPRARHPNRHRKI